MQLSTFTSRNNSAKLFQYILDQIKPINFTDAFKELTAFLSELHLNCIQHLPEPHPQPGLPAGLR